MKAMFFAPDGNDISDISVDQIVELIHLRGKDYWEEGSGDAAIRFPSDDAGELVFMVRKSFGVFLQFTEANQSDWVQTNDRDLAELVFITQGGESWELPLAYFVDETLAVRIITEFISTAQRPNSGKWVPF